MTYPLKAVVADSHKAMMATPGAIRYWTAGEDSDGPNATPDGLNFSCPCGCGKMGGVRWNPGPWTWNGDREKPTVRASVDFNRGHWHGWLTNGEWTLA